LGINPGVPTPPTTKNKYLKGSNPPTLKEKQTLSHPKKKKNHDPPKPLACPSFSK
jgi:hypothetical protein